MRIISGRFKGRKIDPVNGKCEFLGIDISIGSKGIRLGVKNSIEKL